MVVGNVPAGSVNQVLRDVLSAYREIRALPGGEDLNAAIGTDDILLPGLYNWGAAWPLAAGRTITFLGNATDTWVIRIEGAPAISGNFMLAGNASAENIYWAVGGAFSLGASCRAYGTIITPAAISIAASADFYGRLFSTVGAIDVADSATLNYRGTDQSGNNGTRFNDIYTPPEGAPISNTTGRYTTTIIVIPNADGVAADAITEKSTYFYTDSEGEITILSVTIIVTQADGSKKSIRKGTGGLNNVTTIWTITAPADDPANKTSTRVTTVTITTYATPPVVLSNVTTTTTTDFDGITTTTNDADTSVIVTSADGRFTTTTVTVPNAVGVAVDAITRRSTMIYTDVDGTITVISVATTVTEADGTKEITIVRGSDLNKVTTFTRLSAPAANTICETSAGATTITNGDTSGGWGAAVNRTDATTLPVVPLKMRMCCSAMTPSCLACAADMSEESFCASGEGLIFCPKPKPLIVTTEVDADCISTTINDADTSVIVTSADGRYSIVTIAVPNAEGVAADASTRRATMIYIDVDRTSTIISVATTVTQADGAKEITIVRSSGLNKVTTVTRVTAPAVNTADKTSTAITTITNGDTSGGLGAAIGLRKSSMPVVPLKMRTCCSAMTPSCLACAADMSEESFCASDTGSVFCSNPARNPSSTVALIVTATSGAGGITTTTNDADESVIVTNADDIQHTITDRVPNADSVAAGTIRTRTIQASIDVDRTITIISVTFTVSSAPTSPTTAPIKAPPSPTQSLTTKTPTAPTAMPTTPTRSPVSASPSSAAPVTKAPTGTPTRLTSVAPSTKSPVSRAPTAAPSVRTASPTRAPTTVTPTRTPVTAAPTSAVPTRAPTVNTDVPTKAPTLRTVAPIGAPTTAIVAPTPVPTEAISAPTPLPTEAASAPLNSNAEKLVGLTQVNSISPRSRASVREGDTITVEGASLSIVEAINLREEGNSATISRRLLLEDAQFNVSFSTDNLGTILTFDMPGITTGYYSVEIVGKGGIVELEQPHFLFFMADGACPGIRDGNGACAPCPKGGVCPGGGRVWPIAGNGTSHTRTHTHTYTHTHTRIAGYWSSSELNSPVRCPNPFACTGTLIVDNLVETSSCETGHMGLACGQCEAGQFMFAGECDTCPDLAPVFRYTPLVLFLVLIAVGLWTSSRWIASALVVLLTLQQLVVIGTVAMGAGADTPSGSRDTIILVGSFVLDPSLLFRRLCPVKQRLYLDDLLAHIGIVILLIAVCLFSAYGHVQHVKHARNHRHQRKRHSVALALPNEKWQLAATVVKERGSAAIAKERDSATVVKERDSAKGGLLGLLATPAKSQESASNVPKVLKEAGSPQHQPTTKPLAIERQLAKLSTPVRHSRDTTGAIKKEAPGKEMRQKDHSQTGTALISPVDNTEEKAQGPHRMGTEMRERQKESALAPLPPPPTPPRPTPPNATAIVTDIATARLRSEEPQGRLIDIANQKGKRDSLVDLARGPKAKRRPKVSMASLVHTSHTKSGYSEKGSGLSGLIKTLSKKIVLKKSSTSMRTEARLRKQYSIRGENMYAEGGRVDVLALALKKGHATKEKNPPLIWDARGISLGRVFQHRATQLLLLVGTVMHLQTCAVLVRGLHCIVLPEGQFAIADMQTACYTDGHVGLAVALWLLLAVYGVGFPLLCLRLVTKSQDLHQLSVSTQFALKEVASEFNIDVKKVVQAREKDLLGVLTRHVSGTSRSYLLTVFPANLVLTLLMVPMHESTTVGLFILGMLFAMWSLVAMYRWPMKRGTHNVMTLVLCAVFLGLCCAG
jgi:hypothetical protein